MTIVDKLAPISALDIADLNNEEKIHEFSLLQQQQLPSPNQWFHNPYYTPTLNEIKQYRKQRRRMIIPKDSREV